MRNLENVVKNGLRGLEGLPILPSMEPAGARCEGWLFKGVILKILSRPFSIALEGPSFTGGNP